MSSKTKLITRVIRSFSCCLMLLFGYPGILSAQEPERYNVFNYSVNEGLLQSTMGDIAVDKNNQCWISFPNGIQKFNGKQFINIEPQDGLPDNKYTYFLKMKSGDILISHSKGISIYDIANNKFKLLYTHTEKTEVPSKFIGEENGVLYLFTDNENIIALDAVSFKLKSNTASGLATSTKHAEYRPTSSTSI